MNLEHYLVFFQRENKDPLQIKIPSNYTKVIAIDGGLNDVLELKLKADFFVGDCDSLKSSLDSLEELTIYPCEKDFLDGEGALEFLRNKSFSKLTFYSFFQGRWDMSFTHFLSLIHFPEFANRLEIICEHSKILYFNESFQIKGFLGQRFSIIPLKDISNLSIQGAKYNIQSKDVDFGRGTCLSNHLEEKTLKVSWDDKAPLLLELYDG